MNKKYPSNFNEFRDYIVCDKSEVIANFFDAEKCFFYDTCSIQHHSNSQNRKYIIEYLKTKKATIILTRTVLIELSHHSFSVHPTQIQYFKELYKSGIKILLFDEEYIYDCLKMVFNKSNKELNLLLGYAIKEVDKYKCKTHQILNGMEKNLRIKLKGTNPGDKQLFTKFFEKARQSKEEHDSLAEELMFICIIVLTKIPYKSNGAKYIFFSNDLACRRKVISLVQYIHKHHDKKEPYQLTTASMIHKMYIENILTRKKEMLEIMKSTYGENANIFYIGKYDIIPVNKKLSCGKIVDKIQDKHFKIMY